MKSFWLKIGALAVVIIGLVVVVSVISTSQPQQESQQEYTDEEPQEQIEQRRETRTEEYRQRRTEAIEQSVQKPPKPEPDDDLNIEEMEAERLYILAETQYKIGGKMGMSFKKMVDTCREIITRYPETSFAPKARTLLRRLPERHRKLYNVTDEEMGI